MDTLHEELNKFYEKNYQPPNLKLVIMGPQSLDTLQSLKPRARESVMVKGSSLVSKSAERVVVAIFCLAVAASVTLVLKFASKIVVATLDDTLWVTFDVTFLNSKIEKQQTATMRIHCTNSKTHRGDRVSCLDAC